MTGNPAYDVYRWVGELLAAPTATHINEEGQ